MIYSLNEVEATAKKAARGAGHGWGIAEEAGKAARWLCANGLDGCAVLAACLSRDPGGVPESLGSADWHSAAGDLCPLRTGAAVSDMAAKVAKSGVVLKRQSFPLLVLPFAAALARQGKTAVALGWNGVALVTDGSCVEVSGDAGDLTCDLAESVTIRPAAPLATTHERISRATPAPGAWEVLQELAGKCHAPATEESRLLGAGAGLTDND